MFNKKQLAIINLRFINRTNVLLSLEYEKRFITSDSGVAAINRGLLLAYTSHLKWQKHRQQQQKEKQKQQLSKVV